MAGPPLLTASSPPSLAASTSPRSRSARWRTWPSATGRSTRSPTARDLLAFDVGYEDTGEPRISGVERVIDGRYNPGNSTMHYLVRSSSGAKLMVRRIMLGPRNTLRFVVFVADLWSSPRRWVEVNGLGGGEALFVGRQCSRAVRARDAVRADKIFFLDDSAGMSFRMEKLRRPSYDDAVYDMTDGTVSELLPRQLPEDGPAPVTWLFPGDEKY